LAAGGKIACRIEGCTASAWPARSGERTCIHHFIALALAQLAAALEACQSGKRVRRSTLDDLAQKADCAVMFLANPVRSDFSRHSEQMLDLILGVANLQEFLSRNASLLGAPR
jgi:hypothetical protein